VINESTKSASGEYQLRYEVLIKNTGVGIWQINEAGYTEYMNPAMCEILNIQSKENIAGKTFHSFFTNESLSLMKKEHAKRAGKISSSYEVELLRINGEKRNILISGSPIISKNGNVEGMIGSFLDITEQRTFELELKKSEERFRLMFEKITVPTGISRNGIHLLVNEAYQNLFQYTSEELVGNPIIDLIHPASHKEVYDNIKVRAEGGKAPASYELIGIKKDKTNFPFYTEVSYIELPDGMATIASIKDITNEKATEFALKASEAKFRGVFESNMIGIAFSNRTQILEANNKFLSIIGYTKEDLENRKINWPDLTPPEFLDRDEIAVQEIMIKGFITPYEKEYIRKDGKRIPVLIGASLLEGKPGYGTGFVADITDLKQSREESIKLAQDLSTFLYMASHDLKGPLASVIGLTNIALNEIEDPKAIEYFNLIQECTLKLDKSLMNFLKIIRIKDNNVNHDPIDLNILTEEILFSLKHQPSFAITEFQINNYLQSQFSSDEDMIRSMIQNLIENSVKYQTRLRKPVVKIDFKEDSSNVYVSVDDNGRGIDEKIKEKIFNIFYRGDISSKGSGLGLYIVKSAVEKLGGSVSVESKKEGGALFTLTIPKK
jgi:PAS domain S-box-containing protein